MAQKAYQISFDDKAVSNDFYGDVVSLTVEESTGAASSFHMQLAARLQSDGSWTYLDDDRLELYTKVSIKIGFIPNQRATSPVLPSSNDSALTAVFDGYITDESLDLGSEPGTGFVNVQGMDSSVLMGLEEKIARWPNMKDSEIVNQIVGNYGFQAKTDETSTTRRENETTQMQRTSDLQFVKELAQRNGMEFYFETDGQSNVTGFLRAPQLSGSLQPDLAIQAGDESNLRSFSAHLNGQRPLNVKSMQTDVRANTATTAQVNKGALTELGADDADALVAEPLGHLVKPKDKQAQLLFLGTPTSDATEMQTMTQAVKDEADWIIQASGEINSEAYQSVLRPRRPVLVKGAGKAYSGKYYVTRVTHEIRHDGSYTQRFEAKRNARDVNNTKEFGNNGAGAEIPGV